MNIELSPFDFTSSGSTVYLVADNANLEEFKVDWVMMSKDSISPPNNCSYTKIVASGAKINLTTPGYPSGYEGNMNCSWTFVPEDKSRHVVLEVYDILLEGLPLLCATDYIKVMASHNLISWHSEKTMCINETTTNFRLPVAFFDGTPNLRVNFVTDCKAKIHFG